MKKETKKPLKLNNKDITTLTYSNLKQTIVKAFTEFIKKYERLLFVSYEIKTLVAIENEYFNLLIKNLELVQKDKSLNNSIGDKLINIPKEKEKKFKIVKRLIQDISELLTIVDEFITVGDKYCNATEYFDLKTIKYIVSNERKNDLNFLTSLNKIFRSTLSEEYIKILKAEETHFKRQEDYKESKVRYKKQDIKK